ncbi:cyclin-dependent kinase 2-interacting protein-like [Pomacea canaliculata]|uniref:cyclin-dependent kinase 2-interacting protein-like n=1 Tax=Pomacea canaliculata TaxID=400727 RepID=UPI000D735ACA|nr:cyclin-dependent kinase 2-interacting protein-like [Pomacea canaliculata]
MDSSFSPFKSPASKLGDDKGHRLTGLQCKLKDSVADVHNLLLKWTALNRDGAAIISEITACKMDIQSKNVADDSQTNNSFLPLSLEPKCEALLAVCRSMEKIVNKLESLSSTIQGLHTLNQYQNDVNAFLFKTWPIEQFVDTFSAIHTMYKKEHSLKQKLVQFVAHAETRNTLMFYLSAWSHEPYLNCNDLLESLLFETGHR